MNSAKECEPTSELSVIKPLEVVHGLKQVALKVLVCYQGNNLEGLYRPFATLKMQLDHRIPVPQELYRDVCYSTVSATLGWGVAAPAVVWSLKENNQGVLRPYYPEVEQFQHYRFTTEVLKATNLRFWLKAAALDYATGVVDRNSNDILLIKASDHIWKTGCTPAKRHENSMKLVTNGEEYEPVIVDSGLSFVEGMEFMAQHSIIRESLKGEPIPPDLLTDLASLITNQELRQKLAASLQPPELQSFYDRVQQLLIQKSIL